MEYWFPFLHYIQPFVMLKFVLRCISCEQREKAFLAYLCGPVSCNFKSWSLVWSTLTDINLPNIVPTTCSVWGDFPPCATMLIKIVRMIKDIIYQLQRLQGKTKWNHLCNDSTPTVWCQFNVRARFVFLKLNRVNIFLQTFPSVKQTSSLSYQSICGNCN